MKKIGIILIIVSLFGCLILNYLPKHFPIEPLVALSFGYFLLGVALIVLDKNCQKGGIPKHPNPSSPPKKCICNNFGKHSPGGRCEAKHYKNGTPDLSSFSGIAELPNNKD